MDQKAILQALVLGGMSVASVAGFVSLQSRIVDAAECEGLVCNKPEDCGSKCFCNDPKGNEGDGNCYLDS
jgi:hypothetical protein